MSDNDGGAVALVTGAGRGIGFEVSRQLAQRDMIVLLGVRNLEKSEAPIPEGAASVVWVATLPDDGPTGSFFRDGQAPAVVARTPATTEVGRGA